MRFLDVDTVTFTDINGKQYPVKDRREISTQVQAFEIETKSNDLLDEVASRKEVYGDNGEVHAWRIFDLNIAELTQVDFNMTKIKKLKIPLI